MASLPRLTAALLTISLVACGGDKDGDGGGTKTASAATAKGGKGGGGGPGGGPPGVVLAASDVGTVQRGRIEAAIPITGDLRPIETVEVRARLQGDLEGVYVREGDRVRAGQLLARFEASEQESNLRSAQADRAAAQSELATAQWNAEQSQELFKAGAIAEQELRTAQQSASAARARLAAAEARVRSTSSFERDTRVLAPISGVVERRDVENGERLQGGAPMFSIVRNDILELAAQVPSRSAGDLRAGQQVHFVADGRQFDGRVARVSPTVDPTTRSITVYVQIPNGDGALKGNTFATGRVVGRAIDNALLIPAPAVRQSGDSGKTYVFRVTNGAIDRAEISLGVVDDGRAIAQVVEGLKEGDRVVVGNVGTLGAGMKVQVVGEGGGGRQAAAAAPVKR